MNRRGKSMRLAFNRCALLLCHPIVTLGCQHSEAMCSEATSCELDVYNLVIETSISPRPSITLPRESAVVFVHSGLKTDCATSDGYLNSRRRWRLRIAKLFVSKWLVRNSIIETIPTAERRQRNIANYRMPTKESLELPSHIMSPKFIVSWII